MPAQKLLLALAVCFFATSAAFAATPVSLTVDDAGVIQIDDRNERYLTGCWDSNEQAVFYYRDASGAVTHAEICNEPDESHHGLGETNKIRAQNYYDFLKAERTKVKVTQPQAEIVLGSLSGYNPEFVYELLQLPDACSLFDVFAWHPYHLGVAPDEIDTAKDSWHSVPQWAGMYRALLENQGCGGKEMWVTEYGYTTTADNNEKAVDSRTQGVFTFRELISLLASGVTRVSYFHGDSYALDDSGVLMWNNLAKELEGTSYDSSRETGASYCPATPAVCWYDDSILRELTGQSVIGIENSQENKVEVDHVFAKGDTFLHVSWTRSSADFEVEENQFRDLSRFTRYEEAILGIAAREIISGYPDQTFRADNSVNRAELLTILIGAVEANTASHANCFADVHTEWFAPFVCAAKARGWVHGYGDDTFRASQTVTRAEAVKMTVEAFGLTLPTYIQAPENWYDPYFIAAEQAEILTSAEAAEPSRLETRGHIAELVYRALQN